MKKFGITCMFAVISVLSLAQDITTTDETLFVFLDCNARNCDFDHFRREISWVNWVRDRTQSDVHLLITSQRTAAGGLRYQLDFIDREDSLGAKQSNVFSTDPNDTDTEARNQLTNMIALGLIPFIQNNKSVLSNLQINYSAPETEAVSVRDQVFDPWNLWVFRVGVNGGMNGEAQQRGYRLNGFFSARRVNEDYKFEFFIRGENEYQEFDDTDAGTITNKFEDYRSEISSVWSLTPQTSVGGIANFTRSTFFNRDFGVEIGPAFEYNVFPYSVSTTRLLTVRYSIGAAYYKYEEETVNGKLDDLMGVHSLELSAEIQQPWGEIDASIEGLQYFAGQPTASTPYRVSIFGSIEYRLFRGFNVDLFGFYSSINDQFYLSAEGLTEDEILLQTRQRETSFRFRFGVGFSYRFGSKYANVVNPRMD